LSYSTRKVSNIQSTFIYSRCNKTTAELKEILIKEGDPDGCRTPLYCDSSTNPSQLALQFIVSLPALVNINEKVEGVNGPPIPPDDENPLVGDTIKSSGILKSSTMPVEVSESGEVAKNPIPLLANAFQFPFDYFHYL
jgi:hypothetical protein